MVLGGSTIDCPHCHFPTPLPNPLKPKPARPPVTGVVAAVMLLLVAAIAYGTWRIHSAGNQDSPSSEASVAAPINKTLSATNTGSTAAPAPVPKDWNGFQAGPVKLEKVGEGSLVYAVGTLTNTSDQQRFGVTVLVDLFDGTGGKIGAAKDYAQSIDAGKAWQFRAMVVDRGAVKAEIKDVTQN